METLILVIEITAILVFAYSGVIHAHRNGFDFVGVLTIALVTAFGAGLCVMFCSGIILSTG